MPGGQSRFCEGLRQTLSAICQGSAPNLLFFDDMQWADAASLNLLAGQPLFILAAWRSDEGQPAARLAGLVADAQRAGLGTALTLNNLPLARAESSGLAQAITLAEQALALGVAMGDRHREAALHNNLADLLHAAGRSEEAMAQLKQAVVIFAEIGVEAGDAGPEIWKLTEW